MSEQAGTVEAPAGPRVRLPVAVAAVLAVVVLALVAVGTVIRLHTDAVAGGPALPPPAAPATPAPLRVSGRSLTYAEFRVTLPAAPFSCRGERAVPGVFPSYVPCAVRTAKDFDGHGDDAYANVGVVVPADPLVTDDLAASARTLFTTVQQGSYDKGLGAKVGKVTGTAVTDAAPAGSAYAVYGDVSYATSTGRTSDRLLLVLFRLRDGGHVAVLSIDPDRAPAAVKRSLRASVGSATSNG